MLRPPARPDLDHAPEAGQGRHVGGGEDGGPGGGRELRVQDQGGWEPVGLTRVKLEGVNSSLCPESISLRHILKLYQWTTDFNFMKL